MYRVNHGGPGIGPQYDTADTNLASLGMFHSVSKVNAPNTVRACCEAVGQEGVQQARRARA